MEKNLNEEIFEYVKFNDDLFENVVLLSLYNDYKKYDFSNVNKENNKNFVNVVYIASACDNILNEYKKFNVNNSKVYKSLDVYINMLISYNNNFNKRDKEKVYEFVCLITMLESYFKLPLSFPEVLNDCIDIKIKNNNKKVLK